jgi:hypothetical protein
MINVKAVSVLVSKYFYYLYIIIFGLLLQSSNIRHLLPICLLLASKFPSAESNNREEANSPVLMNINQQWGIPATIRSSARFDNHQRRLDY